MDYIEFLDNSPLNKSLWLMLIGVLMTNLLDGMSLMMTSFAMPGMVREFKINSTLAGSIFSAATLGVALGALFVPLFADRIGRKPVFQWMILVFAFGSFLSAIATSYNAMILARFIAGIGLGAEIPIGITALVEYTPLRLRHIFMPLITIASSVGFIVAALLSIWVIPAFGWRSIFWVGVAPALLAIYVGKYMQESIRFLLAKGRTEEAGRIAHVIARSAGMTNIELVPPVMKVSQPKLTVMQQVSLLRPMWVATVMLTVCFFCSVLQTFGVNSWLPTIFIRQGFKLTGSFNYTLMIFMVTPLSHMIAMWMMSMMSRRWALLVMTTFGTLFFFLFGLSFENKWAVSVLVGSQVIQTLFGPGVMAVLYTFSSEVFPTSVRGIGLGLITGIGRFGSVLGPFLLGLSLQWGARISQVIYLFAFPLFVAAILTVLFVKVDTRRMTLENVSTG
jgi:putative MFS transporter